MINSNYGKDGKLAEINQKFFKHMQSIQSCDDCIFFNQCSSLGDSHMDTYCAAINKHLINLG